MPTSPQTHSQRLRAKRGEGRPSAAKRGYDRRWQRLRKLYLGGNPICDECRRKGVVVLATEVHHVEAIRKRPELQYEWRNLQALCKRCHNNK